MGSCFATQTRYKKTRVELASADANKNEEPEAGMDELPDQTTTEAVAAESKDVESPAEESEQTDEERQLLELTKEGDLEKLKTLLNDNSELNIETLSKEGLAPLHIACREGHELAVVLLLRSGANPNQTCHDSAGNRPLHFCRNESVGRWLIAYGARPLPNLNGEHPNPILTKKLSKYKVNHSSRSWDECESQGLPLDEKSEQWTKESISEQCELCEEKFGLMRRRHHCRKCGKLVCDDCSKRKLAFEFKDEKDGKELDTESELEIDDLRVCDPCYNIAHTQSQIKLEDTGMLAADSLAKQTVEFEGKQIGNQRYTESVYSVKKLSSSKGQETYSNRSSLASVNPAAMALSKAKERGQKMSEMEQKANRMTNSASLFSQFSKRQLEMA